LWSRVLKDVSKLGRPVSGESSTESLVFDLSQSILVDFSEEFRDTSDIGEELSKGVELTRTVTEWNEGCSLKDCLAGIDRDRST
jgi:hypothetical protein